VSGSEAGVLFDGYEPAEAVPVPKVSADRRRTLRQAERIAAGVHPLTGGPLHELASRHRDSTAPKSDPFTCGSCWFREVNRYHNKSFAKCWESDGKRATHSAATDVRAWWPACRNYSPSDGGDSARWVPTTDQTEAGL
jgi:hypothetical protein